MSATIPITPDGLRYLHPHPPAPFHRRALLPWICRRNLKAWVIQAWVGTALTLLGTWALVGGWQGVAAAALVAVLPATRLGLDKPVLIDAMALGLATSAAALAVNGWVIPAVAVSLLAGAAKESAPVFAAAFAWNPWLLLGLAAPVLIGVIRKAGPPMKEMGAEHQWILEHPVAASKKYHAGIIASLSPVLVYPWGACVVALAAPTWQLGAVLALAYAQLLVATDTVRLYQWAAPVVALAATSAVDPRWWLVLIALTAFNPARGDGV